MPDTLKVLLGSYREDMKKIFDTRLDRIILYGSYARGGDFKKDSDMDIMILANIEPEEIGYFADKVYDVTYDYEMRFEMDINPSVQSVTIYNKWKKSYPFFMNIEKEGIAV